MTLSNPERRDMRVQYFQWILYVLYAATASGAVWTTATEFSMLTHVVERRVQGGHHALIPRGRGPNASIF